KAQRLIRTVHGQGFRFVGDVRETADRTEARVEVMAPPQGSTPDAGLLIPPRPEPRPSIAVLPFRPIGALGKYAAIADALPDELITELSRLRWLFVIARG